MAKEAKTAGRKEAKTKERFFGPCGHEVKPVRYERTMVWQCELGCTRISKPTSRKSSI